MKSPSRHAPVPVRLLASFWPGCAVALFLVLTFYAQNHRHVVLDALWPPLALAGAVAALTWLLLLALCRSLAAAAVANAWLMLFNGLHGCLLPRLCVQPLFSAAGWHDRPRLLLSAAGALSLAGLCLLLRRGRRGAGAVVALGAFAGCLLAVSVLHVAALEVRRLRHGPASPPGDEAVPAAPACADLPTIVHVVLDGYARADVLAARYGHDNGPFLARLESRGFQVLDRAHSNYAQTALSLASTLNMRYLADDVAPATRDGDRGVLANLIRRNRVGTLLDAAGYERVSYATGLCSTEDVGARRVLTDGVLNEFTQACLGLSWLGSLLVPAKPLDDHRRRIESVLESLPEVAAAPHPRHIFAHVICPHPPFVYDAPGPPPVHFTLDDCSHLVAPGRLTPEAYRTAYVRQLRHLSARLEQSLDAVLLRARRPLIVVLQADHGPGSGFDWEDPAASDVGERTAILCAVYRSSGATPALPRDLTPVNLYRHLLPPLFGVTLPPLPDRVYVSAWQAPYAFVDVTGAVR